MMLTTPDQATGRSPGDALKCLPRRRYIDWNAVERDYRIGELSLRQLAQRHDCSHSAIANRATNMGWQRDRVDAV
jgi:hypothetical protein